MIRKDIFSVKIKGNGFDEWQHVAMFKTIESARRHSKGILPMLGYFLQKEIVHPAQKVVDVFLLAGNKIEE